MANENDGTNGQGAGDGAGTGTGTNQDNQGAGAGAGAGAGQQQQQQAGAGAGQFTYKEDRSKWIPDHRFAQVNQGYQTEKQKREALEQELASERRRVQALAGVTPKSDAEAEDEAIRAAFAAKFPHLADLTAEDIQSLRDMRAQASQMAETTNNYWRNHGRQMINTASESIADKLGGGDLSDKQRRRIARDYIAFVEEKNVIDRHEAGDPKLVDEFVKDFLEDWQEPIRRSITSGEQRRPVPSGRGRQLPAGGKKTVNHNDPKAEADAMVEAFLDHGGQFGG